MPTKSLQTKKTKTTTTKRLNKIMSSSNKTLEATNLDDAAAAAAAEEGNHHQCRQRQPQTAWHIDGSSKHPLITAAAAAAAATTTTTAIAAAAREKRILQPSFSFNFIPSTSCLQAAPLLLLALLLLTSSIPNLLIAQQVSAAAAAAARNTTTQAASSITTTTTSLANDDNYANNSTVLPTTSARAPVQPSTISSNKNSPSATTATATATPSDDSEPLTSTVDAIGVSYADEPAVTEDGVKDATETPAPTTMTSSDDEFVAADGIEPKSISREDPKENDPNGGVSDKANLSIDKTEEDAAATTTGSPNAAAASSFSSQVNMSRIDQIYTKGVRDEQSVVESWHKLGKKMKKGITTIIGSMVPMALNMTQEAKISSNCTGAMLKWVLSMNQLKSWAIRMLDASGKPIAGLLEGSMTMFGNYRQCLKVRAPDDDEIEFTGSFKEMFRGKYCIIQAKPWLPEKSRFYNLNAKIQALISNEDDEAGSDENSSDGSGTTGASNRKPWYEQTVFDELSEWVLALNFVNPRFDLCVPSMCKREDIQRAVNYVMKGIDMKARVLRCEMDPLESSMFGGAAAEVESGSLEIAEALVAASTVKPNSTMILGNISVESLSQIGWILVPVLAISLVLISTALSTTVGRPKKQQPIIDGSMITKNLSTSARTRFGRAINSLSLRRSVNSHMNLDYDQLADDKPLSLYGVRFILVLWVILVESAVNLKFEYLRELMMLKDLIFWWPMQFIINSTLQYDSFILLTAFTMGYRHVLNDGINQGKAITRFVLDKYIRLMPSIMVMVALVILMPLVYRGPVWNDYVTTQSAVCQSTGWINLMFLQNHLPYQQIKKWKQIRRARMKKFADEFARATNAKRQLHTEPQYSDVATPL